MLTKRKWELTVATTLLVFGFWLAHHWNGFDFLRPAYAGSILFHAGFEDEGPEGLEFSGDGHATRTNELARRGQRSLRLTLRRTPDSRQSRAEVVPVEVEEFHRGCYARIGNEYWYAFSIYIPADWQIDTEPESIFQWHDVPDRVLFEDARNPPVALNVIGEEYRLERRWDSKLISKADAQHGTDRDYDGVVRYALGSLRPDLGKWTDWVFRIRWACKGHDGLIEAWKDGVQLFSAPGPNCFNDLRGGPYLKLGPYKWPWESPAGAQSSVAQERVLFVDEIFITVDGASLRTSPNRPGVTSLARQNQ